MKAYALRVFPIEEKQSQQCIVCGLGTEQRKVKVLYRVNAKDQPAIWACADHIRHTDAKVDPRIQAFFEAIADKKEK